ncbi:hypothetical protein ACTPEF_25610, partial [Clostridioides difficile]
YSSKYVDVVKNCAKECNIDVKEGVYMFFSGPNYETPAEVRMADTFIHVIRNWFNGRLHSFLYIQKGSSIFLWILW